MAMLFIGNEGNAEFRRARMLLYVYVYGAICPEVYKTVKHHFHKLRVASSVDNPSSPKQLEELCANLNSAIKEIVASSS